MSIYIVIILVAGLLIGCNDKQVSIEEPANTTNNTADTVPVNKDLKEYSILEEKVNLANYKLNIVDDNPYKRVILIENTDNKNEYKSIFIKETNRLKLIRLRDGIMYNKVIS
ncbi:hypothetical protein J32TS6_30750 [Virgibacillus pantothenticus]|uniref:hypothetical protein n=1 Tax=Virgibacillus TaxID=84406 RepID=UPI00067C4935|nr:MULTISPECIES: hypothetical protein [Virgibacillus]API91578.1 hypothetical protein BKP57_06835 [Virgibacillus sp. 6R]MBS7426902.1 hypothetical protein [Virgibacillus sp. 19R1-5]MBU8567636.1 hypothetical protein [Virgibacillus pantothenticus]MBU8602335.1 hypothetical protein [Virgibacillus pantothenticus]MBU8635663.1 hypothetical protein [Virgibacillus pantothenticus]